MSRWQVGMVAMFWPEKGDREPCRLEDRLENVTRVGNERWTVVILVGPRQGRRFVVSHGSISHPSPEERQQWPELFKERLAL